MRRPPLLALCVWVDPRLAAGQAAADGRSGGRGPAWAPCWEKSQLYSKEECCGSSSGQRRASCFDSIYTPRECCAGDGWARLFPEAESTETAWEDAAHWLQGDLLTEPPRGHPAYSRAQRLWEASMANATVLLAEEVLGHHIQLRVFKRSGPALAKMLEEMREDLYRLRHAAPLTDGAAPVAVDVGAAVGATAVLLAKLWGGARVIAVEPTPANFRYLLWNLRLNGVAARVWPLNVAVGSEPAAARVFFYSPTYPTWSQACDGTDCAPQAVDEEWRGGWTDWQDRFEAEVLTLAEVLAGLGLPGAVHLLKVDCEGCEWGIFAPLSWGRLRHRVRHVAAELHRWALPDAADADALEASVRDAICAHEAEFENLLCSTM